MSTASSGSSLTSPSSPSTSSLSSSAYSAFSSSVFRPSFRSSLFDLEADHDEFLANQQTLLRTAANLVSRSPSPPYYQYPPTRPAWQTREVADSVLRMEMMLIEAVQAMQMKNWGKKKKSGSTSGSRSSRDKKKTKRSKRTRTPERELEPELERGLEPPAGNRTDRESKSEMYTEYDTTVFDSEAEEIVLQAQWRQLMKNPNAQIRPLRRFSMTTRTSRTSESREEPERTEETRTSYGDGVGPAYTENTGRATGGYGYGTAAQTPLTMPMAEQYTQSLGGYSPGTISYVTPSPATGGQLEMQLDPVHEPVPIVPPHEVEVEEEIQMPRGRKRTPKGSRSSGRT